MHCSLQDISSSVDQLEKTLVGLCHLPNELLTPLSNTLVQLSTHSAHSDHRGKVVWPSWPVISAPDRDTISQVGSAIDDLPGFQSPPSSSLSSRRQSVVGDVTFESQVFGRTGTPASDVTSSSVSQRADSRPLSEELALLGYEGDVESEDEQPTQKFPMKRLVIVVKPVSILPTNTQEPFLK